MHVCTYVSTHVCMHMCILYIGLKIRVSPMHMCMSGADGACGHACMRGCVLRASVPACVCASLRAPLRVCVWGGHVCVCVCVNVHGCGSMRACNGVCICKTMPFCRLVGSLVIMLIIVAEPTATGLKGFTGKAPSCLNALRM
jgi:hypothetical protein